MHKYECSILDNVYNMYSHILTILATLNRLSIWYCVDLEYFLPIHSATSDFWSYCLAFGTVRKQFSPESKLVLHHELFSSTHCFLQHPVLSSPKVWSLPFHRLQSPFNLLPFTFTSSQYSSPAGWHPGTWLNLLYI